MATPDKRQPRQYRVHTHDRIAFRQCRRRFIFGSNIEGAMGLETKKWKKALWMGTGIHKALEEYYRHGHDPVEVFEQWRRDWEGRHESVFSRFDEETRFDYADTVSLAKGMLRFYVEFASGNDDFEVVQTEVNFSVPIRDERGREILVQRPCRPDECTVEGNHDTHSALIPAVYEGRFDGIIRVDSGPYRGYWLLEHKSYAAWRADYLINDDQVGSYIWAAKRIYGDYDFRGVLYNVLFKRMPIKPIQVQDKRGGMRLSKDKKNCLKMTTLAAYEAAIEEYGYKREDYAEELEFLEEQGLSQFFRREWVKRTPTEIEEIGLRIYYETLDMASPNMIPYPNPDSFRCGWCPFLEPCIAMSAGEDYLIMLEENYQKREPTDVPELEFMPA